jgi:hypothetical protein
MGGLVMEGARLRPSREALLGPDHGRGLGRGRTVR